MVERYCCVDDCVRVVFRGDLCSTHMKRQQRGQQLSLPMAEKLVSPWERIHAAAIDLADADSEDDIAYARAVDRLEKAIEALWDARQKNLSTGGRRMGA